MNMLQSIDWSVLNFIHNTLQCGFLDFVMPKISLLGDAGVVWIFCGIILIITKRYRKQGILLLGSLVLCFLLGNLCLKPLIARPRPCWLVDGITLLVKNPTDFSFPSGHTLASVAGAVVLTLTNKKFGLFAIPLCLMIAFSRLYLYLHFPTDVLASVFLGVLIGVFAFYIGGKLYTAGTKKRRALLKVEK